jgi:hypothetical protein
MRDSTSVESVGWALARRSRQRSDSGAHPSAPESSSGRRSAKAPNGLCVVRLHCSRGRNRSLQFRNRAELGEICLANSRFTAGRRILFVRLWPTPVRGATAASRSSVQRIPTELALREASDLLLIRRFTIVGEIISCEPGPRSATYRSRSFTAWVYFECEHRPATRPLLVAGSRARQARALSVALQSPQHAPEASFKRPCTDRLFGHDSLNHSLNAWNARAHSGRNPLNSTDFIGFEPAARGSSRSLPELPSGKSRHRPGRINENAGLTKLIYHFAGNAARSSPSVLGKSNLAKPAGDAAVRLAAR